MARRRGCLRAVAAVALLTAAVTTAPGAHAALDDGYPPGQPAPGRTCPDSRIGQVLISPVKGTRLVCTMVDGTKRWWVPGTPVPTPSPSSMTAHMPPGFSPSYRLPESALRSMSVRRDIAYGTSSPAQKLDIYLPRGVANPPLVIWIHGGGFVFGDKAALGFDEGARLLQTLTRNGMAVAGINYRLADEARFPAAGQDVKSAIRFLRAHASQYGFDPHSFATWGDSAGAYLALMAGATGDQRTVFDNPRDPHAATSAAVSAVIDLFGNADFRTMRANLLSHACGPGLTQPPPTSLADNPWFASPTLPSTQVALDQASLYPYLATLQNPPDFFIFHGAEDCSVNPMDSVELNRRLQAMGVRSSLTIVAHAGHGGAAVWAAAASMAQAIRSRLSARG